MELPFAFFRIICQLAKFRSQSEKAGTNLTFDINNHCAQHRSPTCDFILGNLTEQMTNFFTHKAAAKGQASDQSNFLIRCFASVTSRIYQLRNRYQVFFFPPVSVCNNWHPDFYSRFVLNHRPHPICAQQPNYALYCGAQYNALIERIILRPASYLRFQRTLHNATVHSLRSADAARASGARRTCSQPEMSSRIRRASSSRRARRRGLSECG
jgi:hypothetical protein